jgi:spore maturation protein CgeB
MAREKILLVDTTLHRAPWPLFLDALRELSVNSGSSSSFAFFDEARFLLPRTLKMWVLTRLLDHITLNVRDPVRRQRGYEVVASGFRYRRNAVDADALNSALLAEAQSFRPNLIIVVMGFHIAPATLEELKRKTGVFIVNYATDDPFNARLSISDVRASIPLYDLYASTKKGIMDKVRRAGCHSVHYVPFAYNPLVHFPERPVTFEEKQRFVSDVAFIGEGDADRLPFFQKLTESIPNLNLALYGGMWDRHRATRRYARGTVRGRDFRVALGSTKIAVNLIRRGNRDDHVMRTFEAPACGAFLLNERTPEHLKLLEENRDAAYFSSEAELVEKVRYYLFTESEREGIRRSGYKTITSGGNTYKDRLKQIVKLWGTAEGTWGAARALS